MTDNQKITDETLKRLVEVLRDEVFAKSDNEVLSDAAARFGNVGEHIASLKAAVALRVAEKRKAKLRAAQLALKLAQSRQSETLSGQPLEQLKELARVLFERRTDLPERLTLAFRNGESMSQQDWASLIDDLVELGFLSDD
jgi:inactivated superfamily I helicase